MRARALLALVALAAAAVVVTRQGGDEHSPSLAPQIAYANVDPFATTLPPDKRALETSGWAHGRSVAPDPGAKTTEVARRPNPGPDVQTGRRAAAAPAVVTGVIESGQSPFGPTYRFRNRWQGHQGSLLRQVYAGALGYTYNTELLKKKNIPEPRCWADLVKPQFKDEVQVANPNSSGTSYNMLATLVQIMGDTPTGRLHRALVQKGLASSTWGAERQLHDPGYAYCPGYYGPGVGFYGPGVGFRFGFGGHRGHRGRW